MGSFFILHLSKTIHMKKLLFLLVIIISHTVAAQTSKPLLNNPLPDFSATSISGKNWSNKNLLGKVTLISFWYIGCLPCMSEAPYLSALNDSMHDKNFQLISFAKNNKNDLEGFLLNKSTSKDNTAQILRMAFNARINYEVIPGCEFGTVSAPAPNDCEYLNSKLGIQTYPTTIIVDKKGIVRYIKTGFVKSGEVGKDQKLSHDPNTNKYMSELRDEIAKLLNE
jgi:thiol-disulfide isomerase/thioredoxin